MALFEFSKGLLVLIAGLGLLSLIHRDAQSVAENIVSMLHLNPARRSPAIFIEAAKKVTDGRLWALACAAAMYAIIRFVETYGLWHERPWAEWFAVISASLYLPLEIWHLVETKTLLSLIILLVNAGIVIYLVFLLAKTAREKARRLHDRDMSQADP